MIVEILEMLLITIVVGSSLQFTENYIRNK